MSRNVDNDETDLPLEIARQIALLCNEFDAALTQGADVCLSKYADQIDPRWRDHLLDELTRLALNRLRESGVSDPQQVFLDCNPSIRINLSGVADDANVGETITSDRCRVSNDRAGRLAIRCPHCHSMMELIVDASLMEIICNSCGGTFGLIDEAADTHDAATVTRIAHFELIERLGMGQFGTVWKARDTLLERTVALKIPRREQIDALSVEKFMREARAAAQLRHPNIVSTHEVGRHGDTLYIVIDYIRGVPLSTVISDHRLGVGESVVMVAKLADALDHAHSAGVIHRDIKPSNVLIDDESEPHLMDFGLAKRNENEFTMTVEGAVIGTPAYMSPEQARGEAHRVDGRSDNYSLGVILFQLLTGELPFRGSVRMLLQKVVAEDPVGPRTLDSRVPRDLDTICLKCLEKEPSRRYATAQDLAADLRRYLAGQPVMARRLGRFGRTLRWAKRNPIVALLIAATMTTLIAASGISSYFAWSAANSAAQAKVNAARADQEAMAVTDTLYDSLVQEMQLTREARRQGYGENVRHLVDRAKNLNTVRVDPDEMRRQLVFSMGDFVAYSPLAITKFSSRVTAFSLSSDASELYVGQSNGDVAIYDASTGKKRDDLAGMSAPVTSMPIISRRGTVTAADQNGMVRVWRRVHQQWTVERNFQLGEAADAIFFAPGGELVAYVRRGLLDVWDVANASKIRTLSAEPHWRIRNGAINRSRNLLVAGYVDEQADTVGCAVWNLDTGERIHEIDLPSLGATYPYAIDLAKAGDRLAIGFDEALLTFELADLRQATLSRFDSTLAVALSPMHRYLAAANIRGQISIWNLSANRQLATLYLPAQTPSQIRLAFGEDGTQLVASNAERIQIWDLTRASEKTILTGHDGGIPSAAFDPSGRLLATGGKDKQVRFWNSTTGQLEKTVELGEKVQAVAFSPDGRFLAVGCMGRAGATNLQIVDVTTREVVHKMSPSMGEVLSLAWSKGGRGLYLVGTGEFGLELWKVASEAPLRLDTILKLDESLGGGRCLSTVLDVDCGTLAWAQENQLKAWDLVAERSLMLHAPAMHQGWHGLALRPDGESIVYVTHSGTAEVWDVRHDRNVASFGGLGTFNAPQVALSSNGKWLAALTQPDSVSIWNCATGRNLFTLRPETGAIWSLAWDPASERLAVGQSDGGLAIWHLPRIREMLADAGMPWPGEK